MQRRTLSSSPETCTAHCPVIAPWKRSIPSARIQPDAAALAVAEAERVLRKSGISIQKRARAVDRLAAVLLLQSYLDSLALGSLEGGLQSAARLQPGSEPEA